MQEQICVSIIIPVYNQVKFLERCLESVFNQSYSNLEIIIMDDGSTDGSSELCDRIGARDGRIAVYHQENQGLSLTRQNGIKNAHGEYIYFLDSDDWIETEAIEILVDEVLKEKADLVTSLYTRVYDNGKREFLFKKFNKILCLSLEDSIYETHVSRNITTSACGKLIKRELFDNVTFPKNLAIGEEHDMVEQIIVCSKKVVVLSDGSYYYYLNSSGISRSGYNRKYYNSLLNYIRIKNELILDYPNMKGYIISFYNEYEMAIITAMCRNKNYDKEAIDVLACDIRKNIKEFLECKESPFYMRMCGLIIAFSPKLFIVLFRILHICTGR